MKVIFQDPAVTLRVLACALADAREHADVVAGQVWTAEQDYREQHADLLADHELAKRQLAEANDALRTATVEAFLATGEKRPAPGVSVALRNTVEYDDADAWAWVRAQPDWWCYVLLATAPIKARIMTGRVPFGRVVRQPTAQIATRLRAALNEGSQHERD